MTTPVPVPPPVPPTLNLPPDVVDKLAPAQRGWDDWWYTQGATVGSAVIALGAAVVAFLAIRYQVAAEDKRRHYAERVEVVLHTLQLLREIKDWSENGQTFRRPEALGRQKYEEYFEQQVYLTQAKLQLVRMPNEADQVRWFWQFAKNNTEQHDLTVPHDQTANALKRAVNAGT